MKKVQGLKSTLNKDSIIDRLQRLESGDNFVTMRNFTAGSGFVPKYNPFLRNTSDEMDLKSIKTEISEVYDVIKNIKSNIFIPKFQYLQG